MIRWEQNALKTLQPFLIPTLTTEVRFFLFLLACRAHTNIEPTQDTHCFTILFSTIATPLSVHCRCTRSQARLDGILALSLLLFTTLDYMGLRGTFVSDNERTTRAYPKSSNSCPRWCHRLKVHTYLNTSMRPHTGQLQYLARCSLLLAYITYCTVDRSQVTYL